MPTVKSRREIMQYSREIMHYSREIMQYKMERIFSKPLQFPLQLMDTYGWNQDQDAKIISSVRHYSK
jgi:hypothetical protein